MNKERRDEIHALAARKIALAKLIGRMPMVSNNSTHESDQKLIEMTIECLQALDESVARASSH